MSLRLSFIVPFYNVEPYVEECIRSLYAQDIPWEEYEVICVDDCSPDGSRAIVERLQKEYSTLKLLTTPENLRQGGARNMALDVAEGRYICFVDSDDYIKHNAVKALIELAETEDLDILDFDFDSGALGISRGMYKNFSSYSMGVCTGTEYVFDEREVWANKCGCVCAMLIRKSFLDEHNLRFAEKMQYEDTDFAIEMFFNAKRVFHIGEKLYFYRYVTTSTTHKQADIQTIIYNADIIKRLINIYIKIDDQRWNKSLDCMINDTVYELLVLLRQTSFKNQFYFYSKKLGVLDSQYKCIGRKNRLALTCWPFLLLSKKFCVKI